MRIGIVNDMRLAVESLRRAVATLPGASVAWIAEDGAQAVACCARDLPDIVLMDMIMPVMDGEEFYVRLREQEKGRSIPVLIASVNDKMPQRIAGLGGVAGNLKKPFAIDVLLEKIRTNLK